MRLILNLFYIITFKLKGMNEQKQTIKILEKHKKEN